MFISDSKVYIKLIVKSSCNNRKNIGLQ